MSEREGREVGREHLASNGRRRDKSKGLFLAGFSLPRQRVESSSLLTLNFYCCGGVGLFAQIKLSFFVSLLAPFPPPFYLFVVPTTRN